VLDYDNPVCLSSVLLFYYHLAYKPFFSWLPFHIRLWISLI
jgi:hypothetical protein